MKKVIAAIVLLVGAGAAIAVVTIQSAHAKYVRETMTILPKAEDAYTRGQFDEATRTAGDAAVRLKTNPTWFPPADAAKIREDETFYAEQLQLWNQANVIAATIPTAPAKARTEFDALIAKAQKPRGKALLLQITPKFETSLARERESVEAASATKLADARKAYEQASWEGLLSHLDEVHKTLEALPAVSRPIAAATLAKDLKGVETLAARVNAMRSVAGNGVAKADTLRAQIGALDDLKGRDRLLHRELLRLIAAADPETRKAIAGVKMRASDRKNLIDEFVKGGDFEVVGDPRDLSQVELQGAAHRYTIKVAGNPPALLIEADRVRLQFPIEIIDNREARCLVVATELAKALRASGHAHLFADEPWAVCADAPGTAAMYTAGGQVSIWLAGRVFEGKLEPERDGTAQVTAVRTAARALEAALKSSPQVPEEIRAPLATVVKAAHSRAPPNDYLDGEFCRLAVAKGYVEDQVAKLDGAIADRLKEYKTAYEEVARYNLRFEAKSSDGAVVQFLNNLESENLWRLHDPAANTTTFSNAPLDPMMHTSLVVHSVFKGNHETFPTDAPVEIRMAHALTGTVSRWAGGKFTFDPALWAVAVAMNPAIPAQFNSGDWQVPPHAVRVDARGQVTELILLAGVLKVESFRAIAAGPKRREAQEKFLQRCSETMLTPGELHLFFRYLVQYVLDSPVTTATTLIGSSKHSGDMHQDAYQTLDRAQNGRFLADCDDLAEFYWNVLKRQGRLAYVLGVPGHATCGVAEKDGEGWRFFCVDTGPPRQFTGKELDTVVEKLLRTYDDDGSMPFDPRSIRFLFRFAGEQTRSDYYLDSRILRDAAYADLMIRVQEYWHFGFYALGIETMLKVLETDKMSANCQEVAGLYTRVGMFEEALKWTEVGIQGLDSGDPLSLMGEQLRKITFYREMKKPEEAIKTLRGVGKQIAEIERATAQDAGRYRWLKFQVAAGLSANDLPWEGWDLVGEEVVALVRGRHAPDSLMAMVTEIYSKMQKAKRGGATLTSDQEDALKKVGSILETFYATGLFKGDDSNADHVRKYAQLLGWYAATMGPEKAYEELLKPEYPQDRRNHAARRNAPPALDWAWIRLTPYAYAISSDFALDKENREAHGAKAAIAQIQAMEAALPAMRAQGSLGTVEFAVLDLRLLRACLEMDERAIKSVFDEMMRQGWGQLYEDLSRTLGRAAAFMKPEDFEKVFRMYCAYDVPRRHYYLVVYAALGAEARAHALAASKVCIEKFPKDADMKREHEQLQRLVK